MNSRLHRLRWPHWLRIVQRDLSIAGLPPELDGATLVQMSALRAGSREASRKIPVSPVGVRCPSAALIALATQLDLR